MMKPNRPSLAKGAAYPAEFRGEAVRYWLASGQTLAAVAADLGLSPQCLRSWREHLEASQPSSPANPTANQDVDGVSNQLTLARENGQLRRELEAMTRQRDILKKAISIFSEDKAMSGGLK